MQSSYFKTGKEKTRKFRRENDEYFDRKFEKKREKHRDERRKQKRSENFFS